MAANPYSEILKRLFDFTQLKYNVLSQAIGYDISYISKWITGARLPAAKNVDTINQETAIFFVEAIIQKHLSKDFSEAFNISVCNSKEELAFAIYQCLSNAYRSSIKKSQIVNQSTSGGAEMIMGRVNCQTLLQKTLKENLENLSEPVSIIITGEFSNLSKNHFWNYFKEININVFPCNIHVLLDMSELENTDINNVGYIYRCLDNMLNYDMYIYQKNSTAYENIIVIENKFAILYYTNEEGYIDMCVSITNPIQVQIIYNKCRNYIETQSLLLLPKVTLGMDKFGYRDTFFTSNKYFYYLTNGFEFLLPDVVFDSIRSAIKEGLCKPATEEWINRVQVVWKNLMDKGELHFLLPTNAMIRYLETGYIHLNDFSYQLTKKERKLHIQQILSVLKTNPDIVLGTLLPTTDRYHAEKIDNLSFYSNYSTGFFKKNLHEIPKNVSPVYLITNAMFLHYFQHYFENQAYSPHYRTYDSEKLMDLYKKYHFLLDFLSEPETKAGK